MIASYTHFQRIKRVKAGKKFQKKERKLGNSTFVDASSLYISSRSYRLVPTVFGDVREVKETVSGSRRVQRNADARAR